MRETKQFYKISAKYSRCSSSRLDKEHCRWNNNFELITKWKIHHQRQETIPLTNRMQLPTSIVRWKGNLGAFATISSIIHAALLDRWISGTCYRGRTFHRAPWHGDVTSCGKRDTWYIADVGGHRQKKPRVTWSARRTGATVSVAEKPECRSKINSLLIGRIAYLHLARAAVYLLYSRTGVFTFLIGHLNSKYSKFVNRECCEACSRN